MPYEVRRPSDKLDEKPRLSKLGRTVVAVAAVLALVIVGAVYASVQASRARDELAQAVLAAIDRAEIVCANAASAVGAGAAVTGQLETYGREIDQKRLVEDKAAVAQQMLTYTIGVVGTNQAQLDELHGAVNRIVLAMREYQAAK
jgi:hypothetical protein